MREPILILAAHPDDDILGCGASMAKFSAEGKKIHVAFLSDGVSSRNAPGKKLNDELTGRRKAAKAALEVVGVDSISFADFPDNKMDSIPLIEIAKVIESLILEHKPKTVLTHNLSDVNIDHRRVHEATVVACRPQPGHSVKTILCYEVPSSTEWQLQGTSIGFLPNWYVDVTLFLELKLKALSKYDFELRQWPHPRSIEAVEHLARWRGATVGVEAAEAFMLGRNIL